MTREEFLSRRALAERWGSSYLWSFGISILFAMIIVLIIVLGLAVVLPAMKVFRGAPPSPPTVLPETRRILRFYTLGLIGFCVLIIGSIYLAGWVWWPRWLKRIGMQCPSCQHPLFGHYGRINPATGRCSKCEETGRCRNIGETGLCDKCGQRIFD